MNTQTCERLVGPQVRIWVRHSPGYNSLFSSTNQWDSGTWISSTLRAEISLEWLEASSGLCEDADRSILLGIQHSASENLGFG